MRFDAPVSDGGEPLMLHHLPDARMVIVALVDRHQFCVDYVRVALWGVDQIAVRNGIHRKHSSTYLHWKLSSTMKIGIVF